MVWGEKEREKGEISSLFANNDDASRGTRGHQTHAQRLLGKIDVLDLEEFRAEDRDGSVVDDGVSGSRKSFHEVVKASTGEELGFEVVGGRILSHHHHRSSSSSSTTTSS